MPGKFKMTPEVMDQVIFGMENQMDEFVLDSETCLVVPQREIDRAEDDSRYFDLPEWTPADGYRLMDGFAGSLKNPIFREKLRSILNSGRGVFRGFKNVLKERPDLEKQWFLYKEREMKRRVTEWYAELCGYWDAREAGPEPEDTEDLFYGDFTMKVVREQDPEIRELRDRFCREIYRDYPDGFRDIMIRQMNWRGRDPDLTVRAETPDGTVSGIITLFMDEGDGSLFASMDCLYVLPEYRGAGIAAGLLDYAAGSCYETGADHMFCFLPPEGQVLTENLKRKGYRSCRTMLGLDLKNWYYEIGQQLKRESPGG